MKKVLLVVFCAFLLFLNLSCETTKSKAVEGGVIGGALGAVAGGIIGHQSGHGVGGAVIGGATGAAAGAIIGSQIEKKPAQETAAASGQVSVQQIVDLSKQGVSEGIIIDKIRATNSKFTLTEADVKYLKQEGVGQKVIDAMQGK